MALPGNINYDPQTNYGDSMQGAATQASDFASSPPPSSPATPSPMDDLLAQTKAASSGANRNTQSLDSPSPKSVDLSKFSGLRNSLQTPPQADYGDLMSGATSQAAKFSSSPNPSGGDNTNTSYETKGPDFSGNTSSDQTTNVLTSLPTNIPWGSGTRKTAVGQCGALVNDLAGLHMGDSLQSKEAVLDPGLSSGNVSVGDVFVQAVQNDPYGHGHTGFINSIGQDEHGRYAIVTEANYHLNGLTTHNRKLYLNDPAIRGFAKPKKALGAPAQKTEPTNRPVSYATSLDNKGVAHRYSNLTGSFHPVQPVDVSGLTNNLASLYNKYNQG